MTIRSILPDDMIVNFPRPNPTVFLEILADTSVRGVPVAKGEIVEVSPECASNIVSAGRGQVVQKPAGPDPQAPETPQDPETPEDGQNPEEPKKGKAKK